MTQVPLADHAGVITRAAQHFCDRRASVDDMPAARRFATIGRIAVMSAVVSVAKLEFELSLALSW